MSMFFKSPFPADFHQFFQLKIRVSTSGVSLVRRLRQLPGNLGKHASETAVGTVFSMHLGKKWSV